MIKKNFKIALIIICMNFDTHLIAGNKHSNMAGDVTEVSKKEISMIIVGVIISNVIGDYVGSQLNRQFDGTYSVVESDAQLDEEPLCPFTFDKDTFGKLSEDGSHDYRSNEELEDTSDEGQNVYELVQRMNCDNESGVLSLDDIKNKCPFDSSRK